MTPRRFTGLASRLVVTLCAACGAAKAEEIAAPAHAEEAFRAADAFDADLFGPSAPALVTLGLSPKGTADPGALRDIDFDLSNVGTGERLGLGAAVSIAPYWLGARMIGLQDYREGLSRLARIGARTQASLGIAAVGTEHEDALTLGLGLETQLLDAQDEKADPASYACMDEAWQRLREPVHREVLRAIEEAVARGETDLERVQAEALARAEPTEAAYLAARKACQDDAIGRLLARPSLKAGLGLSLRSEEDDLAAFAFDGASLWTSYRLPLDPEGRYAGFAFLRADTGKVFDLDDDRQAEGDQGTVGLGLGFQRTWLRLDGALAYHHRSFDEGGPDDDGFLRATGDANLRLFEGIWLRLGAGSVFGSDLVEGAFYSAGLKMAFDELVPGL